MDTRADVARAVDRVTHLLRREDFLWDFVFEKSIAGAALLLTNAEAFRHAVSAAYSDTFFAPGVGDEADCFGSHTLAEVLFVPAFSKGRISIGAAVTRSGSTGVGRNCGTHPRSGTKCVQAGGSEAAAPARLGGHSGIALGRFVRDDASGELLLVLRPTDKRDNALVLLHFAHHSTVERERTMVVLDDAVFTPSSLSLQSAVTCVQETVETRSLCPVCDTAADVGCDCAVSSMLDPRGAVNSLDYGAIRPTMLSHVGGMAGRGRVLTNTAGAGARRRRPKLNRDGSKSYAGPVFEVRCGGDFVTSPPLMSWMQICGRAQESDAVANEPRVLRHWRVAGELRVSAMQGGMISTSPTSTIMSRPPESNDGYRSFHGYPAGISSVEALNRIDGSFGVNGTCGFPDTRLGPSPFTVLNRDSVAIADSEVFIQDDQAHRGSSSVAPQQFHLEAPAAITTAAVVSGRESEPVCGNFEPLAASSSLYSEWQDVDTATGRPLTRAQSDAPRIDATLGPFAVPTSASLTIESLTTAGALEGDECTNFPTALPCAAETVVAQTGVEQNLHHVHAQFPELHEAEALAPTSTAPTMCKRDAMLRLLNNIPNSDHECIVETPAAPRAATEARAWDAAQDESASAVAAEEAKRQERKVRNRIAAAKSNKKRKEKNDRRKNEKARLNERIVELKIKQAELLTRKEMMLGQLSDRNTCVPARFTQRA